MTQDMSTPLYASPEVLLHMDYDQAVDIWASGLVMAELLTGKRLLESLDTAEQLQVAVNLFGQLSDEQQNAAEAAGFTVPRCATTDRERAEKLSATLGGAVSPQCVDLLQGLLCL